MVPQLISAESDETRDDDAWEAAACDDDGPPTSVCGQSSLLS